MPTTTTTTTTPPTTPPAAASRSRRSRPARPPRPDPLNVSGLTPRQLRGLPQTTTHAALAFVGPGDGPEYVVFQEFRRGAVVREHAVDLAAVAAALSANLPLSSGILPGDAAGPNILFWAASNGAERVGVWVGPRVWLIGLKTGLGERLRRLKLPFPGMVFVTVWRRLDDAADPERALRQQLDLAPYVFACPTRPLSPKATLYHAPAVNVFASGRVCMGSHAFPRDPLLVPGEFFGSYFQNTADTRARRSKKHPDDVGALWDELDGTDVFPVEDLVPQLTLGDAFNLSFGL